MKLSLPFGRAKKPSVDDAGPEARPSAVASPYLNARRNWNDHVYAVMRQALVWKIVGIAGLLMGIAAIASSHQLAKQSKFVPYVIEVNQLGEYQAVRRADRLVGVTEQMVKATVSAFIQNARLVTPDVALQRKAIFNLYAHLSPDDPSTMKMNEWLDGSSDRNPFNRAKTETVTIEQEFGPMQQSAESWQIDWVETVRDRNGAVVGKPSRWRAVVSVYIVPPDTTTTEQQVLRNPIGVWVRDWNWARQP